MEEQKTLKVWTVDAFAEQLFQGNPAAVIPVQHFPSDHLCLKIAAEFNLSETAFVECQNGKYHIRWFTPATEVKLCGHATLAAAHILFQEKLVEGNQVEFQSLSGPLRVLKSSGELLTLDFPLQPTGPVLDIAPFQKLIGLTVVNVVQANDDVIIELADHHAVRGINVPASDWAQFEARGIIVTARGEGPYDFVSRFFAPRVGINEDPVTGSAHCKLAHYWKLKLGKEKFKAYQASKRGGVLEVEVSSDRVLISGKAITVITGSLRLD